MVLACYLLIVSYFAIPQTNINAHWKTLIHLSAVSALTVAVFTLNSIIPFGGRGYGFHVRALDGLWFASLAFHLIGMLIVINIPGGPPLHCDPANLYNQKTLESITNDDSANVAGITGMLSYLAGR